MQIRLSFEDFDEALSGFKASSSPSTPRTDFQFLNALFVLMILYGLSWLGYERIKKKAGLWVDKYKPRTLEELSVHNKKAIYFFPPLFLFLAIILC